MSACSCESSPIATAEVPDVPYSIHVNALYGRDAQPGCLERQRRSIIQPRVGTGVPTLGYDPKIHFPNPDRVEAIPSMANRHQTLDQFHSQCPSSRARCDAHLISIFRSVARARFIDVGFRSTLLLPLMDLGCLVSYS